MSDEYNYYQKIESVFKHDSFYLFDLGGFISNYQSFLKAARDYYPNTQIGYSYKTNYLPIICNEVNRMGGYAEVVSSMEYELANNYFNVPTDRIIVNGPIHTKEFIFEVLNNHSILQIDSFYILDYVQDYCDLNPNKDVFVSLRFNYTLDDASFSRFGIENTPQNIEKIHRVLSIKNNLKIMGLHCHFSTGNRSIKSYIERATKLIQIYNNEFKSQPIQYLNFGGGFFSRMPDELKNQFRKNIPEIEEYTAALGRLMADNIDNQNIEMIIEPGTAIVADCMNFISKVYDIKMIQGQNIVLTNGSVHNIKPTGNNKNLPCKVVSQENNIEMSKKNYMITGYTCMERDILRNEFNGYINKGDYIIFENIGAYTNVFKPPFIKTQSPIIAIDLDQSLQLAKKPENTQYIIETYSY